MMQGRSMKMNWCALRVTLRLVFANSLALPFAFYCIAVPAVAIDVGGVILPGVRGEIAVPAGLGDLGHVTVNMPFKRLAVMSSCLIPAGSGIDRRKSPK
jgi:hypothetical protein